MKFSRRKLITKGATAIGAASYIQQTSAKIQPSAKNSFPTIISTWSFGEPANKKALEVYRNGGSILDSIEHGIKLTEDDKNNTSVGIGGLPNSEGVVQLDACIMNGPNHAAGSVMALEGIKNPISIARKIMEKTPHVQLAGLGAKKFAKQLGFSEENLLTTESKKKWENWKKKNSKPDISKDNHDTIALLMIDGDGNLAGGCSTSGLAFKMPGRVGDSPIIGGGLYVDNEIGAAGATGLGENILRHCCSFMIVELMRQGLSPTKACEEVIKKASKIDPRGMDLNMFFIALDKKGRYGAAGTNKGFQFSVTNKDESGVIDVTPLAKGNSVIKGGNEISP